MWYSIGSGCKKFFQRSNKHLLFHLWWEIHFPPWFIVDCVYTTTYLLALLAYFSRLVSNAAAVVSPKCDPQDFFHQPIASDGGGRTRGQGESGGTSDSSVHISTVSPSQLTVEVALKFFQSTLKPDFALELQITIMKER